MVDIGSGPVKESIDNTVFIIPGIIIGFLVTYVNYKIVSSSWCTETLKCRNAVETPEHNIDYIIF
ncbi:hypothetical protein ACJMK2_025613 [Sinanodonta woodiana]|uniref:Uncharacterized protein n=1 Tax=Sinanodonta woodiana TaxID=1069815 RepID=A0ABD3XKJ0_SINWO